MAVVPPNGATTGSEAEEVDGKAWEVDTSAPKLSEATGAVSNEEAASRDASMGQETMAEAVAADYRRQFEDFWQSMPMVGLQGAGPTGGGALPGEPPDCPSRGCHAVRHGNMFEKPREGPKSREDLSKSTGGGSGNGGAAAGQASPTTPQPAPSGPPGVKLPGAAPTVRTGNVPKPTVTDRKLANIVKDLYKGTKTQSPIGTGSTADAIRFETDTGKMVHGKFHSMKGRQYINAIETWLRQNPTASASDRAAAAAMLDDLRKALAGQ